MVEGGFFQVDGQEVARCYAVAFDYDERQFTINRKARVASDLKVITIE